MDVSIERENISSSLRLLLEVYLVLRPVVGKSFHVVRAFFKPSWMRIDHVTAIFEFLLESSNLPVKLDDVALLGANVAGILTELLAHPIGWYAANLHTEMVIGVDR